MKLLLFLFLFSCTKDIVTPCEFTLTDRGEWVDINIFSAEPSVDMYLHFLNQVDTLTITSHYYDCIHVKKENYEIIFEINGCKQKI